MPLMLARGKPSASDTDQARSLLADVGMEKFAGRNSDELSGGQQQRVAVARALVTQPALLLADEPTGNLDSQSADEVFALFQRSNEKFDCAALLVTHDHRIPDSCDRVVTLQDGRLVGDEVTPKAGGALLPPPTS